MFPITKLYVHYDNILNGKDLERKHLVDSSIFILGRDPIIFPTVPNDALICAFGCTVRDKKGFLFH